MREYKCLNCGKMFLPGNSDAMECTDFCSESCESICEAEEEKKAKIMLHPGTQKITNNIIKEEILNLRKSLHVIKKNILAIDRDYKQACNLLETAIEKLETCLAYRISREEYPRF
ncbi:MAG: hypothetical protein BWY64_03023 [bacterium ADurb.Bin363]|nr:MAG: hypothetical protein BWY64_03023 [bacterium ADurb.Bin363]